MKKLELKKVTKTLPLFNCNPDDQCEPTIGWPCHPDDCIPAGSCNPDNWSCSPDGTDDD